MKNSLCDKNCIRITQIFRNRKKKANPKLIRLALVSILNGKSIILSFYDILEEILHHPHLLL